MLRLCHSNLATEGRCTVQLNYPRFNLGSRPAVLTAELKKEVYHMLHTSPHGEVLTSGPNSIAASVMSTLTGC